MDLARMAVWDVGVMARSQIRYGRIKKMKLKLALFLLIATAFRALAQPLAHKVILLDAYHNREPKQPMHYRWEGTANGGFSDLGNLLRGMGAELKTATDAITSSSLKGIDGLIIVDPDTPDESPHPHYISPSEIKAIAAGSMKAAACCCWATTRAMLNSSTSISLPADSVSRLKTRPSTATAAKPFSR
jgi:hypothetical protein